MIFVCISDQKVYLVYSQTGTNQRLPPQPRSDAGEVAPPLQLTSYQLPSMSSSSAAQAPAPALFLVGTCIDMCPASERVRREREHDISVFEMEPKAAMERAWPRLTTQELAGCTTLCYKYCLHAVTFWNRMAYRINSVHEEGQFHA